jgi:hypothetical protein
MTSQEKKIERLSKILTSVLQQKERHNDSYIEAYNRVRQSLEHCIQDEKQFNREQLEILKKTEEEEKKRNELREAMQKHHFKLLQQQIAERAANRQSTSQKRNWKIGELKYSEEYVWKGMNRDQWRAVLDSQITEKNKLKQKYKKIESDLDQQRVEMAKKSLEEELKIKETEKQKRQNEMWESWEKTKEVHKLKEKLERVRRYGNVEYVSNVSSPIKKNDYFHDILKGYEKTFGKVNLEHSNQAAKTGVSIVSSGRLSNKRSRSSLHSTGSYTSALAKLGYLTQEEEKLKQKKIDLIKRLEKSTAGSPVATKPVNFS